MNDKADFSLSPSTLDTSKTEPRLNEKQQNSIRAFVQMLARCAAEYDFKEQQALKQAPPKKED